jgi:hypothetical protein
VLGRSLGLHYCHTRNNRIYEDSVEGIDDCRSRDDGRVAMTRTTDGDLFTAQVRANRLMSEMKIALYIEAAGGVS